MKSGFLKNFASSETHESKEQFFLFNPLIATAPAPGQRPNFNVPKIVFNESCLRLQRTSRPNMNYLPKFDIFKSISPIWEVEGDAWKDEYYKKSFFFKPEVYNLENFFSSKIVCHVFKNWPLPYEKLLLIFLVFD